MPARSVILDAAKLRAAIYAAGIDAPHYSRLSWRSRFVSGAAVRRALNNMPVSALQAEALADALHVDLSELVREERRENGDG